MKDTIKVNIKSDQTPWQDFVSKLSDELARVNGAPNTLGSAPTPTVPKTGAPTTPPVSTTGK